MSLKIEDIQVSLSEHGVSASLAKSIIDDLKIVEGENKSLPDPNKKKNTFLVVLQGDKSLHDKIQVAHIVSVKEDFNPANLASSIEAAKVAHNAAQKKKKNPVNSLNEFFSRCKAKFAKAQGVGIKTKTPVQIVWF